MAHRIRHTARVLVLALGVAGADLSLGQLPSPTGPGPHEAALKQCAALARNDPNAAIPIGETLLADQALPLETQMRAWVCIGQARAARGDPAGASAAVSEVLVRLERQPTPEGEAAFALGQAGGILQTIGQTQRAAALYQRSHELTRQDGTPRAEMIALLNLAGLHGGALNDPAAADPYFRRAVEISKEIGSESSYIHFNYGYNLMLLHKYDEALVALERATELAGRAGQQEGVMYRADSVRGEILTERGQLPAAATLLEATVEGQHALPDAQGEAITLRRLANLQRRQGEVSKALETAREALQKAEQGGFREEQVAALREMAAIQRALGQHEPAAETAEQRHRLEVTMLTQQNLGSLAALQSDLESQAGARVVERLRHENQIQALNVSRADLLRNLAVAALAAVVGLGIAFVLFQRRIHRKLLTLSTTDPLTGLLNRRSGSRLLSDLKTIAETRHVLLLVDADRFKGINDSHGHQMGDHVLIELARRLKASCRGDDLIARWGGEEFLIACRQHDFRQAQAFAERLRRCVAEEPVALANGTTLSLTVSIGFAPFPFIPGRQVEDWNGVVGLADRALYAVKRSGRDAWAGVWNAGNTGSLEHVESDPQRAAAEGLALLASSRPVVWSAAERTAV